MNAPVKSLLVLAALLRGQRSKKEASAAMIAADVLKFRRMASTAESLAMKQCNSADWNEADVAKRDRLRERGNELAKAYGLTVKVGGDPRGFTFKLIGLPGNSWGGDEEGYGL